MSTSKRGAKRAARNTWDLHQRTILCLLYAAQFSPKDRVRIFNHIFNAHLASCGFSDGLKGNALSMQMHESKRDRSKKLWKAPLAITSSSEREAERAKYEAQIDSAVKALSGLSLSTPISSSPQANSMPPSDVQTRAPLLRTSLAPQQATLPSSTDPGPGPGLSRGIRTIRPSCMVRPNRYETPPPRLKPDTFDDKDESDEEIFTPRSSGRELLSVEIATPRQVENTSSYFARSSPSSPSRRRKRNCREDIPKVAYRQSTGRVINLSPGQVESIQNAKLVPITPDLAHPPLAGLLFRYFDEHSHGTNSKDGFVAGRFTAINGPRYDPPPSEHIASTDIENHMNRYKVASPFISTSDNLIWLLRLAMKEAAKGAKKGCIATIDAQKLDKKGVYWAKPFHAQLNNYFAWTNGAWRYPGSHERLIWDRIPQSAILKVVTVDRLLDSTAAHPSLHKMLDLSSFASNTSLKKSLLPKLRQRQISVATPDSISAIAALAAFLGLNINSPYTHIEHFVHEVVLGWGLAVLQQPLVKWAQHASSFVEDLCRYTRTSEPRLERKEKVKVAFLYGIRNSLAGDWNILFHPDPERYLRTMHNKARLANLQDPPGIIRLAFEIAVKKTLETLTVYSATQEQIYGSTLSKTSNGELENNRFDQFRFDRGSDLQRGTKKKAVSRSAFEVREVIEVEDDEEEEERSSDFEMLDLSDRE